MQPRSQPIHGSRPDALGREEALQSRPETGNWGWQDPLEVGVPSGPGRGKAGGHAWVVMFKSGMGSCRIRILIDPNLVFLEPDVFTMGCESHRLNAIPKDERPASRQAAGAERPRDVLSVPPQEVLLRSASQKCSGELLLKPS